MDSQRELDFHNTIPIEGEDLQEAKERAKRQQNAVLVFFEQNKGKSFIPSEVYDGVYLDYLVFRDTMKAPLLTSIRRAITNLTTQGYLRKCGPEEMRMGPHGVKNRTWTFNSDRDGRLF